MKITLNEKLANELEITKLREYAVNESEIHWSKSITIDLTDLTMKKLNNLKKILSSCQSQAIAEKPLKELQSWINICGETTSTIKKLEDVESALIKYVDTSAGHRIYVHHKIHDELLCYVVTKIEFIEGSTYNLPDSVVMTCAYDKYGERYETSSSFYFKDVNGRTVPQILANHNIYIETNELRQEYLRTIKAYTPLVSQIGKQYTLTGTSSDETPEARESYSRDHIGFTAENSKVVIDVLREKKERDLGYGSEKVVSGVSFWKKQHEKFKGEKEPLKSKLNHKSESIEIPIHPILVVFDLNRHMRLTTHVNTLALYKYDRTLSEKLVLPDETKGLVRVLIEHKEGCFQDIIQGKSGGVLVLLAGPAGVGKTLTAEVFAESKEKPLYTIQAAQLGVQPEDLERELRLCLSRALRWDAVLLIDEADVYIHKRGKDIKQNAIVGAFLRVLEYHSSFLFMTTNRSDVVDDAIISRCIAKIDYKHPKKEDQQRIWSVLAKAAKIKLDEKLIETILSKYDYLSGRDIKNLLKLANLMAVSQDIQIDIDTVDSVVQFNPLSGTKYESFEDIGF